MVITPVEIKTITPDDVKLLQNFLDIAGSSLKSFRYFEKRPFSVLQNHIVTCVLVDSNQVIGYGHLDRENDRTWLGIAIAEEHQGKGYGKLLMNFLISKATENKINCIHLTVDADNINAKHLYEKIGFSVVKQLNDSVILMDYKLEN
ncbi:MAG: GNAT family N-acetyltransferase [Mucilaginibacter sp.]